MLRTRPTLSRIVALVGAAAFGALPLLGCGGPGMEPEPDPGPDREPDAEPDVAPCVYPAAPAVMAADQPLPAFSWPTALDYARNDVEIDLERAYCNDDDIEWSPFDVLLFVSIPAW